MKCKELIDACNKRIADTGALRACVNCPIDDECDLFADTYGTVPINEDKLHNGMYYTDAEVGD